MAIDNDVITSALTAFVTSGTATLILFGLTGYIGKVWLTKIVEKEKLKHTLVLEKLNSELKGKNDEQLASITNEFEIFKNTHLREHNDKLIIYRTAIEMIATMLAKLELIVLKKRAQLDADELETFETERLRIYGYLGMLAPQRVMDANDDLTDLLISVVHENKQTDWVTIRGRALNLINAMRSDIGLDKSEIRYNGLR